MSKKKQKLWLISMLLIYIGIAVVGFVIIYIIKNDFFPKNPTQPTVASKVTSFPTPVGWRTYTNSDYQLVFSYPAADTIQTKSFGFGVSSLTLQNTIGTDFQILLLPKQLSQEVGQDFDSYYAMPDNSTKIIKSPLSQDSTTDKFTKISNITVNGLQAIDYQSVASNAAPGTPAEIGTYIEIGNNLALISTGAGNKEKLEEILKTFQYPM